MEKKENKPQKKESSEFGLPKATFKPIERRESSYRGFKILMIIIGIMLLLGGSYYVFFRNSSDKVDYLTPKELEIYESAPEAMFFDDDLTTKEDTTTEKSDVEVKEDKPATEGNLEMLRKESEEAKAPLTTDTEGEITRISAPQGTYFVVVGSYVDSDLALDYANKLTKQGVNVMLIEPSKKAYFLHVAIDQGSTFDEANDKASALKSSYGEGVWVLKY